MIDRSSPMQVIDMAESQTSQAAAPAFSFESIFSPEIIADPYPMYRQLRENSPVLELPDANLVVLTRYADVQALLRDRRMGHQPFANLTPEEREAHLKNPAVANLARTMLLKNPPDHTRLRGLVVKAFDARRVTAMRERIRAIAHELIDGFVARGSGDLRALFNHPLPVIVICDMLGIPEADRQEFVKGTRISGRLIDPSPMTEEELAQANASTEESQAYFAALCEERRRHPEDDLITALVQSETEHGRLSREELTSNIALLFAAGHETTVNLLGNALLDLFTVALGNPYPSCVYIGHSAFKAMGARVGYLYLNLVPIVFFGVLQGASVLAALVPIEGCVGFLFWIGLQITASGFEGDKTPEGWKHGPAVAHAAQVLRWEKARRAQMADGACGQPRSAMTCGTKALGVVFDHLQAMFEGPGHQRPRWQEPSIHHKRWRRAAAVTARAFRKTRY